MYTYLHLTAGTSLTPRTPSFRRRIPPTTRTSTPPPLIPLRPRLNPLPRARGNPSVTKSASFAAPKVIFYHSQLPMRRDSPLNVVIASCHVHSNCTLNVNVSSSAVLSVSFQETPPAPKKRTSAKKQKQVQRRAAHSGKTSFSSEVRPADITAHSCFPVAILYRVSFYTFISRACILCYVQNHFYTLYFPLLPQIFYNVLLLTSKAFSRPTPFRISLPYTTSPPSTSRTLRD